MEKLSSDSGAGDRWVVFAVPGILIVFLAWFGFSVLSIALCLSAIAFGFYSATWVVSRSHGQFLKSIAEVWFEESHSNDSRKRATESEDKRKRLPWEDLYLPEMLNTGLETLLDQIVEEYVNNWYQSGISRDRTFLMEIRFQLRYACSRLYLRLQSIDLASLVANDALSVTALHVRRIIDLEDQLPDKSVPLSLAENQICSTFPDLHYAVGSRQNEINYLRQVADLLIPLLLDESRLAGRAHDDDSPLKHVPGQNAKRSWPSHSVRHFLRELVVNCIFLPLLDLIADPDTLNQIVISLFDRVSDDESNIRESQMVPFLSGLTDMSDCVPDSLLQLKLTDILRDARLFSMFRLYLQDTRGPVNELLFLAESSRILESIHKKSETASQISYDIWQLYSQFLHESAPERIQFEESALREFGNAFEQSDDLKMDLLDKIVEQSFQTVYNRMQCEQVVPFCQSDSFLGLLCGSPPVSVIELIDIPVQSKTSATDRMVSFSMFRSQLRRLFTGSMDGSIEADEVIPDEFCMDTLGPIRSDQWPIETSDKNHLQIKNVERSASEPNCCTQVPSIDVSEEDIAKALDEDNTSICSGSVDASEPPPIPENALVIDRHTINMNTWKVSIGKIMPTRDRITGRTVYVYVIDVERGDAADHETRQWSIFRRFTEFYILESKLVEFHREALRFTSLPPRKTFVNKNRAFLEQHRLVFSSFISSLCKQKLLHRSDLLSAFLTSPDEFRDSLMLSDLNPWKVVKSMPSKLSREKGQHLRPFLLNMLASVLAPPEKPPAFNEKVELGSDSSSISSISGAGDISGFSLYSSIFGNNLIGCKLGFPNENNSWTRSPSDSLLLLFESLVNPVAGWILAALSSIKQICSSTIDYVIVYFLRKSLLQCGHESTMLHVVHLIQQSLFCSEGTTTTQQEKSLREELAKRRLLELVQDGVPSHVTRILGRGSLRDAIIRLVRIFQYPRLNKHLSYLLLDTLVRKFFLEDEFLT